uniref:Uncharacterized protein n=1 Tax=Rhizophora mucronata TaxID=61149 RepID=A0A2P2IK91_RHIMU
MIILCFFMFCLLNKKQLEVFRQSTFSLGSQKSM